jgi:hypothetical protein
VNEICHVTMKSCIADLILGRLIFQREQWDENRKREKKEFELDRNSIWVSTEKSPWKVHTTVFEESFMPVMMGPAYARGIEMLLC